MSDEPITMPDALALVRANRQALELIAARLPDCHPHDPLDVAAHAVSAILERDRWCAKARAFELQLEAVREALR